jgi:hypothetical protein
VMHVEVDERGAFGAMLLKKQKPIGFAVSA